MRYRVVIAGRTMEVDLGPQGVQVDGERVAAELQAVPDGPVQSLLLDGASHRLVAHRSAPGHWELQLRGWRLAAEVVDERTLRIRELTGAAAAAAGPRPVRAPMPGLVVRVEVAEGDEVKPGQGLVIVEAMKMENELRAEIAGRVQAVHVQAGQAVEKDQVLIDLGPVSED
jgi:pyruvate carboxylase subunit B